MAGGAAWERCACTPAATCTGRSSGPRRGALRRFGGLRVKRGARVLRLRAHVKGAGRSNVVRIRVGR